MTATLRFPCPSCGHTVVVGLQHAGKRGQCPRCQAVVRIPAATPTTGLPATIPEPPLTNKAAGARREVDVASPFYQSDCGDPAPPIQSFTPAPTATATSRPTASRPRRRRRRAFNLILRPNLLKLIIFWGIVTGPFLLAAAFFLFIGTSVWLANLDNRTEQHASAFVFSAGFLCTAAVMLPWFWLARLPAAWLAPRLAARFYHSITCPTCGERNSIVSEWVCNCGYRDYRRVNVISHRCPKCREASGLLECPRCGTTILI